MPDRPPLSELRRIYEESKVVAVVGASPDPAKPSHRIPAYLQQQGYEVIPVNPEHEEVLGVKAYPKLTEVPRPVDIVDVFRPAPEAPEIARQAVQIGAKVLWLQQGIVSEEAADIGRRAGLAVVMDRCIGQMHAALGLGPGPGH